MVLVSLAGKYNHEFVIFIVNLLINMISFLKSHNTIFLLLFSVFCSALIFVRVVVEGEMTFLFLIKNLGLAWLPYLISQGFRLEKMSKGWFVLIFLLWLLFFPNALYSTTDLFYIYRKPRLKVWFDIVLLLSYVLLALFLAFASLKNLEVLLYKRYTRFKSTVFIIGILYLASVGVYLGRFKRLNSSDIFTRPKHLLQEVMNVVIHPFEDVNFYIITFVFTISMYLFYYGLFHFAKNHK